MEGGMTKHQKPPAGEVVELPLADTEAPTKEQQRAMLIEGVKDFDAKFTPETPDQLVDRMMASNLLVPVQAAENDNEFDWLKNDAVVVPTQLALAVYENPQGAIVIRQERDWCQEEDSFIVIEQKNLMTVIDRLCDIAGIPAIGGP
jgi:hypothetical protein